MDLRPYQKDAIKAATLSFLIKKNNLLVLPTGSGKTVVFSLIAKEMGLKTLVVSHTREIVDQISITSKKLNIPHIKSISIQSCSHAKTIEKLKKEGFDLLVIDECHRSHAKSYKKLIDNLGHKNLLGVTATPFRTDKKNLKEIYGDAIFNMSLIQMIEEGFLCDYEGYRVETKVSLNVLRKQRGDFSDRQLSSVINVSNRNKIIVNEYKNLSSNEKSLCFCADVKHAMDLREEFVSNGITCECIHGAVPVAKRRQILKDFKEDKIQVVTNCQVLTEGFDEPSIKCLIMARPTCSKVLYMQMIGRGSRLFPGKKICKVIEFTDNNFDVCFLEDLLEKKVEKFRIPDGQTLREGFKRLQKILSELGEETVITKNIIIPKTIYERPASDWQIQQLNKLGICFEHPLTEFIANYLIGKEVS